MRKIVMVVVGVGALAAAIALALMDCGPQDDWDLVGSVLVDEVIPDEDWAAFNNKVDGLLSNSYMPNGAGRTLLAAVVPTWEAVAKAVATDCFSCRATEIVVAAELYRRRNGKRPFSLSELVPAFLDSVPADPYKPDSPLNYDALCGIIWTVGADGDFNGDKEPEKNSYGRNRRYVIYLDGTKAQ